MNDFYRIVEELGYHDAGIMLQNEYDDSSEGHLHYQHNVYELIEHQMKGQTYEELCRMA